MPDYGEIAEGLTRLCGRKIRYRRVAPEARRLQLIESGLDEWLAESIVELETHFGDAGTSQTVPKLESTLGRSSRNFEHFAMDHRDAFCPAQQGGTSLGRTVISR